MENIDDSNRRFANCTDIDTLTLSYPTLTVDDSIASLVLVPRSTNEDEDEDEEDGVGNMRPAPPSRTPSEAASSLGESTYDLVSNPDLSESGIFSDDDARTESLASFDGNTPDDDMSVIDSGEDTEEEEEDALNTPLESILVQNHDSCISAKELLVNVQPTIDDSNYTAHTVTSGQSMSFDHFHVSDAEPHGRGNINVVQVFQTTQEVNRNHELDVYDARFVGVSMHMAIAETMLQRPSPLRVLVVGCDTQFDSELAQHLASALGVTTQNEDGHQLLVLQHLVGADSGKNKQEIILDIEAPSYMTITLRGGEAFHGEDSYPMWDLAIFLHTSLANVPPDAVPHLEAVFEKAQLGLSASNVPITHLSIYHPLFQAVPRTFSCDPRSLHLCIKTKENIDGKEILREILPVEVDQFLAIDPDTLNRHLACITGQDSVLTHSRRMLDGYKILDVLSIACSRTAHSASHLIKSFAGPQIKHMGQMLEGLTRRHIVNLVTAFTLALTAMLLCTQLCSTLGEKNPLVLPISPIVPRTTTPPSDMWSGLRSRLSGPSEASASLSTSSLSPRSLIDASTKNGQETAPVILYKAVLKKNEEEMVAEAWKQYSLEPVNGHTFILSAPPHLAKLIKRSPVFFVTKDGEDVNAQVKQLSDGRWAIDVPEGVVHGGSTLTLRAQYQLPQLGHFPFEYQFAIHHDKSSFEKVKDLVAQEFILVQDNVMELSTRMTTGLQQYIDEIQQHALAVTDQAMKRVDETKKVLVELSSGDAAGATWQSKKQRLRRLKKTKKALRKHGKDVAHQIQDTFRAAQDAAFEQLDGAVKAIRALPQWQRQTAWPVRAVDWHPKTAARRGLKNAQGLLRTFGAGPKSIDGPSKERLDSNEGWVNKRKERNGCDGRR